MKEIKLTQGKVTIVDDEDYGYLNQFKWYALKQDNNIYYAVRTPYTTGKKKTIYMHRAILSVQKGEYTDHINHNGLDNRKGNLRVCTNAENCRNSRKHKNNTSGFKGVSKQKIKDTVGGKVVVREYIRATICHKGKRRHIGLFKTEEDAARAYDKAAKKYYGEFAKLNVL